MKELTEELFKIDKSKLSGNELILQQAREDCHEGKITKEEFSNILSKYGNHKKITKADYLKLPAKDEMYENVEKDNFKTGSLYRIQDEDTLGKWTMLLQVNSDDKLNVKMEAKLYEII